MISVKETPKVDKISVERVFSSSIEEAPELLKFIIAYKLSMESKGLSEKDQQWLYDYTEGNK